MRFSNSGSTLALIVIVGTFAFSVAQPMMGQSPWDQWHGIGSWYMGPGMMMGAAPRHQLAMMSGIPEPYRSLSNPLPRSAETVERGGLLYHQNCASCHGATGRGDGAAAHELSPPPANLAWLSRMPMVEWDPFMYWTIAEGVRRSEQPCRPSRTSCPRMRSGRSSPISRRSYRRQRKRNSFGETIAHPVATVCRGPIKGETPTSATDRFGVDLAWSPVQPTRSV